MEGGYGHGHGAAKTTRVEHLLSTAHIYTYSVFDNGAL